MRIIVKNEEENGAERTKTLSVNFNPMFDEFFCAIIVAFSLQLINFPKPLEYYACLLLCCQQNGLIPTLFNSES